VLGHILKIFKDLPAENQEIIVGSLGCLHEELEATLSTVNDYYSQTGTLGKVIRFCNSQGIEYQFKMHHKSIQACINNLHFAWSVAAGTLTASASVSLTTSPSNANVSATAEKECKESK